VIVVGGGTAFMLWRAHGTPPAPAQQNAAMVPDSSHAGNADTSVTGGTEAPVNRHDTSRAVTPPNPEPQHASPTGGTAADTTKINRELGDLLDSTLDSAAAPRAIQRAQQIYNDASLPANLRANAASVVSSGFQGTNHALACQWITKAIGLDARAAYITYRKTLGCPQ